MYNDIVIKSTLTNKYKASLNDEKAFSYTFAIDLISIRPNATRKNFGAIALVAPV
jgi:hypothetical protein